MIANDVRLGKDVTIYHPDLVNLYGCEIGDGCKIGAFVEIRKQVNIGRNVKIQAFVFIPEGVTIEDGAFIGPHRSGDMWAPQLDRTEALRTRLCHFIKCIEKGKKPLSDGEAGWRIVRILEAATRSIKNKGKLEIPAS